MNLGGNTIQTITDIAKCPLGEEGRDLLLVENHWHRGMKEWVCLGEVLTEE